MGKNKWIGISVFILLIVAGAALSVVAMRIGSDYLRSLAIVLPASLAGDLVTYFFGKKSYVEIFSDKKHWWGFAAGVLIVTTLLWLLEKLVF